MLVKYLYYVMYMRTKNKGVRENIYDIENIYCGTKPANQLYKEIIEKILDKDNN